MRTAQTRSQQHGQEERNLLSIKVPAPFLVAGFICGGLVTASVLGILLLSPTSHFKPLAIWTLPLSSSGMLFLIVLLSVFRGEILYGGKGTTWSKALRRAERPVGFWFVLAAFTALAVAMMLLGLTGLHSHLSGGRKSLPIIQSSPLSNPIDQSNTKNNSETVLKVRLGENEFVDQVQILQSCGQPECDAEAIEEVKKASFQSLRRDGKKAEDWLIVKVSRRP